MKIKLKDDVNLDELLNSFKDNGKCYELKSMFDEFIFVNKTTREIIEEGYSNLVRYWIKKGLVEQY